MRSTKWTKQTLDLRGGELSAFASMVNAADLIVFEREFINESDETEKRYAFALYDTRNELLGEDLTLRELRKSIIEFMSDLLFEEVCCGYGEWDSEKRHEFECDKGWQSCYFNDASYNLWDKRLTDAARDMICRKAQKDFNKF